MRQVNCTDSSRRVVSCRVSDSHGLGGLCGRLENHTRAASRSGVEGGEEREEERRPRSSSGSWKLVVLGKIRGE